MKIPIENIVPMIDFNKKGITVSQTHGKWFSLRFFRYISISIFSILFFLLEMYMICSLKAFKNLECHETPHRSKLSMV